MSDILPHYQLMMDELPPVKILPTLPILYSGVDYAGSFKTRVSKDRVINTWKDFVQLFVCRGHQSQALLARWRYNAPLTSQWSTKV